ncbi:MAG: hypothetical protein K6F07_00845 [Bacilli bacterium]|nr:hypothetical protein [Bacilli bacterium]
MKRNLVKILAMSSLLLTLGACGGNKKPDPVTPVTPDPVTPTVEEVEINFTQLSNLVDGKWEYEGKIATLTDACVIGVFEGGKHITVGYSYEQVEALGVNSTGGAEVYLKEAYEFKELTRGLGAEVTVKGLVADENGHVVLKDAEISDVNERVYDASGARQEGTGCGLVYYTLNDPVRDNFNTLGRADSAITFEFEDIALVTIPEVYDGSKDVSFYVNFPGENPFVEDDYNLDIIECVIPAGLDADIAAYISGWFRGHEVGDQVDLVITTLYEGDSIKFVINGLWGAFFDSYLDVAEPIEVVTTYAEATAVMSGKYNEDMPEITDDEYVYKYELTNLWASQLEDITGVDLSWVSEDLAENGGLVALDFYTTFANSELLPAAVGEQLVAAGYTAVTSAPTGTLQYRLLDGETVVNDVLLVAVEDDAFHYLTEMIFVGERATTSDDFTSWDEARADYVSKQDDGFTTALPDLPATPAATGVNLSWIDLDTYEGAETYRFAPQFDTGAFADNDAWEAYAAAYGEALVAAGFLADGVYLTNDGMIEGGYLNLTSGEFVFFDFATDLDDNITGLTIYSMVITDASDFYSDDDAYVWTDESAANYTAKIWSQIMGRTYTPSYSAAQGMYYYNMGSFYATYKDTLIEYAAMCVPASATSRGTQESSGTTYYIYTLNDNNDAGLIVIQYSVGATQGSGDDAYFDMQMVVYAN